MPRRAKTKPILAVVLARRMSIGSVIVTPTPTAGTVDRRDHRLQALEDAQRRPGRRHRAARPSRRLLVAAAVGERRRRPPDRSAPAQKPRPAPGDDHGAHVVVGVDAIEGVDHLAHHLVGERVELVGPVQRDRGDVIGDVVEDLRVVHAADRTDRASEPTRHVGGRRPVYTSRKRLAAVAEPTAPTNAPSSTMTDTTADRVAAGDDERRRARRRREARARRGSSRRCQEQQPAAPSAPPARPCSRPSSMNGSRMNQLVAPTSFITSISRRRANIAVRIVFQISRIDGEQQHRRRSRTCARRRTLCSLRRRVDLIGGKGDLVAPRAGPERRRGCSATAGSGVLSTGSTAKYDGIVVGVEMNFSDSGRRRTASAPGPASSRRRSTRRS